MKRSILKMNCRGRFSGHDIQVLEEREESSKPHLQVEEREYSILPVMSELSTVRCDRVLGLWIAGTRASNVDGELPWRSSCRAVAVASTPGSRTQAAMEGGFLGLRHKTKQADGG